MNALCLKEEHMSFCGYDYYTSFIDFMGDMYAG